MSQLLNSAARLGAAAGIPILTGVTAPDYIEQGIPYDGNEGSVVVAVEIAGIIDHYHQGLPFTAVGRLAVTNDKAVGRIAPGGAPFEAVSELLVFGSGGVDHYAAGIPYTAQNQLAIEPPP